MLKSVSYGSTILLLILVIMQLAYLHPANAQYTRVDVIGGRRGTITCPTGEQYEGTVSISSTSSPSMSGYYDIIIAKSGSSALKSGLFDYVKINSSGEFILKGKETRDDICGSLTNLASVPIVITGQCVFFQASKPPTIIKFRAASGEKADFPSAPGCS